MFLSVPGDDKPRAIRAVYQDGTRLSGDLEKVEKGLLVLNVPGISQPPKLPLAGLRSLVAMRHPDATPLARSELTGRLELDGLRLPGRLVDGRAQAGASCLVWQPLGSDTASALKPGVSGRIIYREPPPPAPSRVPQQNQIQGVVMVAPRQAAAPAAVGGMVMRFAQALAESPAEPASTTEERRSLYLRDGDVIPSIITKIDADGVWFKTSLSKSTFVAHAKVKAVELANEVADSTDRVVAHQVKKRQAAHVAADAEGRPAHASDPFQERRLPPRTGHEDGRQDARGRGPAREQGGPARADFPDHLAARRRA